MKKVVLLPHQSIVEVEGKDSLLRELKAAGVPIKSSCGGHATCADCVVKIIRGEENLTPPPFEELRLLGNVFHLTRERLCCQTKALGEVVIDISGHEREIPTCSPISPKVSVRKNPALSSAQREQKFRPRKKGGHWRPKPFKNK